MRRRPAEGGDPPPAGRSASLLDYPGWRKPKFQHPPDDLPELRAQFPTLQFALGFDTVSSSPSSATQPSSSSGGGGSSSSRDGTIPAKAPSATQHRRSRCGYDRCVKPDMSSYFYNVEAKTDSGGKDWAPVAGMTLCQSCYSRYRAYGTLEHRKGTASTALKKAPTTGPSGQSASLPPSARSTHKGVGAEPTEAQRCSHPACEDATRKGRFYRIDAGTTAGVQDWGGLVGRLLCKACYERFRCRDSLDASTARAPSRLKEPPKPDRPRPEKVRPRLCAHARRLRKVSTRYT